MKHFIISLAIVLLSANLFAQNWSPIQTNEKMNFQHSDSSYISHTIWVDDFDVTGSDTTFFLNKIVKDHPTDIDKALRNQPQFLFTTMNKLNDGVYHFTNPGYYILKTWVSLGDTWLFDPDNNLQATVIGLLQEEILEVMDSVKTISLSNGTEIKLSKSFGLIKFPDFENGGIYELIGIQDTEFGLSVPDFWDIYNFEVGDIFQNNEDLWVWHYNHQITTKITITDKTVSGNTLSYNVDGISSSCETEWYPPYPPPSYSSNQYTAVIEFNFENDLFENKFPNELVVLPDSESQTGTGQVFAKTHIYFDESLNAISKRFGMKYSDENVGALYYDLNEESDTIYKYNDEGIIGDPCGKKGLTYSNYIGDSYYAEGCLDSEDRKFLEGYVKDGDTIGTITPDSTLLTVSIENNLSIAETIKVYPNPASDILHILLSQGKNVQLEIRNIQGEVVQQKRISKSEEIINVSDLSSGIYFYRIIREKESIKTGKLIIQ